MANQRKLSHTDDGLSAFKRVIQPFYKISKATLQTTVAIGKALYQLSKMTVTALRHDPLKVAKITAVGTIISPAAYGALGLMKLSSSNNIIEKMLAIAPQFPNCQASTTERSIHCADDNDKLKLQEAAELLFDHNFNKLFATITYSTLFNAGVFFFVGVQAVNQAKENQEAHARSHRLKSVIISTPSGVR